MSRLFTSLANISFRPLVAGIAIAIAALIMGSKQQKMSTGSPVLDLTIADIVHGFETGSFTSRDLVGTYLARIRQVNPILNAVAETNPDALNIAIERDRERLEGRLRGPLHGVPILYKDAFFTDDPMDNTVGSVALRGSKMEEEATVVTKLKDAGAIMLGTATLTEWCNLRTTHSPHGWSASWGQCYGAYYPHQDPGGSSSGSAVAVSVGFAPAALGTETWGSITMPSQKSSVVGIKPTPGLVSRDGMFVLNQYQDTPGVIARSVNDAARVLQVVAEPNNIPNGNVSAIDQDYIAAAKPGRLEGVRIASPSHIVTQDGEVVAQYKNSLQILRGLGATVLEEVKFPEWTVSTREENEAVLDLSFHALAKINMNKFLARLTKNPNDIRTLTDLIDFHKSSPAEKVDEYGIDVFEIANALTCTEESEEFRISLNKRYHLGREIERLLDATDADALVVPGSGDTPSDMGGNPAVLVPLGFYSKEKSVDIVHSGMAYKGPGIPFGVMFIGRRNSEAKLLRLAAAYEAASGTRDSVQHCIRSNIELDVTTGGQSGKL